MSGHSHWSTIKHQKGAADAKRSKIFSKIAKIITVAAKEKGGDPETNSKLRLAMDQAKAANMPQDNIERAIKRGAGELESETLEEVMFEAYGPGGSAIIIEGITDNKNRTLGEIKQSLSQYSGKLGGEGSVKWMFNRKGCLTINSQEKDRELLELTAIEAGAEDISWQGDRLNIYTKVEDLEKVKGALEEKGLKLEGASLDWVAKEEISVNEKEMETCQKLFEALDENDSVQEIYSNIKQ